MTSRLVGPAWLLAVVTFSACGDEPGTRPSLARLTPDTATLGSGARQIVARGGRFLEGAEILWNGLPRPTTFVGAVELRWTVTSADLSVPDTALVRVRNPPPDTTTSNALPFFVEPPFFLYDVTPEGGTQMNADSSVTVRFSRGLDVGTLTPATFAVRDSQTGTDVAATVSYDGANQRARLTPTLAYNKTYVARVTTGLRSQRGDSLSAEHTWTFYTPLGRIASVVQDASWPALARSPDGTTYVGYAAADIKLASCTTNCGDSTRWQHSGVLAGSGAYLSLSIDGRDRPHMAFTRSTTLTYGFAEAGSWQFVTVDPAASAAFLDLEADGSGRAHIAYYEANAKELRYATCGEFCANPLYWTTRIIDNVGDPGPFAAIAIGPGGSVHVAYHAYGSFDLRYATCASACDTGTWQTAVIDSAGAVGWGNGIAVDAGGTVHFVGLDYTNGTVRYGRCSTSCMDPARWSFAAVAPVANPRLGAPEGFYYARISAHGGGLTLLYQDQRTADLFTADCAAPCSAPATWMIRRVSRRIGSNLPSFFSPGLVVAGNGTRHGIFGSQGTNTRILFTQFF